MVLSKLNAKTKGIKYLPFEQDGISYNLYDMPKGFVIKGDLDLSRKGLTELPDLSEVVVKGNFYCSENKLTSLDGAPQTVGGDFNCSINQLTSLEGAPKEVGGGFSCFHNELTSLEGAPQTVGGYFSCSNNQLTSLESAPKEVGGDFNCSNNQLISLLGLPQMKESMKIYCDDSLGNKYGLSSVFSYKELCASPLYKSESAMNRVRSKLPQENIETKQQEAFEKINSQFSQWLKDNSIKLTRE